MHDLRRAIGTAEKEEAAPTADVERDPLAQAGSREIMLKTLTDNAASALMLLDVRGHVTFMNPAFTRITGYTETDVRGRTAHEVIHYKRPDGRHYPIEECPIDRSYWDLKPAQGIREVFVRKDGTLFPVLASVAPLVGPDGRTVGGVLEFRDISSEMQNEARLAEEKQALETLQGIGAALASTLDLEQLLQAITDAGVSLSGAAFGSFFYNAVDDRGESYQLYTISGVPREAFSKFPMPRNTQVFAPTFRGEGVVRSDDITKDPRYGKNAPHRGMPAGHLPVRSYLAVPVRSRSGDVIGGLFFGHPTPGVFTERSERLLAGLAGHASVALDNARLFQQLQRELERRRQTEAELRRINESLEEFAYAASHDLKEPLRGISTAASLLEEFQKPRLDAEGRERLESIRKLAKRMYDLTDAMLAVSRLGRGGMKPQRIPLGDIVRQSLESVAEVVERSGAEVEIEGQMPELECDPVLVGQVVTNLVVNAIKYNKSAPPRLWIGSRNGAIYVRDNGIGIDPKHHERIFGMFKRLHTQKRFGGGTGVGLAIVKRIAEMHGGRVWVESELGKGATFWVALGEEACEGAAAHPGPKS